MELNIAICDDEVQNILQIGSYIDTYKIEYDHNLKVSAYNFPQSLLDAYIKPGMFHILFLSVEMPDMSGLELAKQIRQLPDRKVKIIFTSNYSEYMQYSFIVQAFDYLKNPISYEQFRDIMNRLIDEFREDTFSRLLVRNGEISELIDYSDILYFETIKNKRNRLRLVLRQDERIIMGTISEYEAVLKDNAFFLPHRSYLVNLRHVHYIAKNRIILDNKTSLPLSRKHESEMKKLFTKQILHIRQRG